MKKDNYSNSKYNSIIITGHFPISLLIILTIYEIKYSKFLMNIQ